MKNAAVCFSVKDKQLYILKPDEIHLPKCYQIFNWKKEQILELTAEIHIIYNN